ncbi:MAG TPA: terminase small subunit [Xanthobacteraceae bacterium]|jgi:hypothetical protein
MPALRSPKEELFAHEVAAFTPIDRAYLAAGYRSKPQFARGNAGKLLRKPAVAKRTEELRKEFRARCALQLEYLQRLQLPVAEANALDYFEPAGKRGGTGAQRVRFKRLEDLTPDQGRAVASVKLSDKGKIEEVRFHNKNEAIKSLMASIGIKESEQSQNVFLVNLGQRLSAALARADEIGAAEPQSPQLPGLQGDERVEW